MLGYFQRLPSSFNVSRSLCSRSISLLYSVTPLHTRYIQQFLSSSISWSISIIASQRSASHNCMNRVFPRHSITLSNCTPVLYKKNISGLLLQAEVFVRLNQPRRKTCLPHNMKIAFYKGSTPEATGLSSELSSTSPIASDASSVFSEDLGHSNMKCPVSPHL